VTARVKKPGRMLEVLHGALTRLRRNKRLSQRSSRAQDTGRHSIEGPTSEKALTHTQFELAHNARNDVVEQKKGMERNVKE